MSIRNRATAACVTAAFATLMMASAPTAQEAVQYGYDALGRVVTVTYGNGTVITYAYDPAGNRTEVTTGTAGGGPGGGNSNPVAVGDYFERRVGTSSALLVLANDSDPDSNPLHVSAVTTPTGGTATIPSGGASVTYVAPGTPGSYTFSYTANDGQGGTANASVEVFVKLGQSYCNQFPDDPYC
ncbi:Ig-like domain-containing protein [Brevundimonas sp.]|uniref:Ig-like domain-containing protein n=1 Tax=Brevundimonas sp. TaxID=1871086 RepID=UPI002D744E3C|nr:Ig-like domain-containing protein [Brevundimonas sp.]HYC73828.1 Ig-like domain-containing protein [Brevundimonas sp.]